MGTPPFGDSTETTEQIDAMFQAFNSDFTKDVIPYYVPVSAPHTNWELNQNLWNFLYESLEPNSVPFGADWEDSDSSYFPVIRSDYRPNLAYFVFDNLATSDNSGQPQLASNFNDGMLIVDCVYKITLHMYDENFVEVGTKVHHFRIHKDGVFPWLQLPFASIIS